MSIMDLPFDILCIIVNFLTFEEYLQFRLTSKKVKEMDLDKHVCMKSDWMNSSQMKKYHTMMPNIKYRIKINKYDKYDYFDSSFEESEKIYGLNLMNVYDVNNCKFFINSEMIYILAKKYKKVEELLLANISEKMDFLSITCFRYLSTVELSNYVFKESDSFIFKNYKLKRK
jgi:hypothetical protein